MLTNVRNIAIVMAIAALVVLIPGGGTGANFALQAVSVLFLAVVAWLVYFLYRQNRLALYSLGGRRRAVLYASAGLVVLTLSATPRLVDTTPGLGVWVLLLVAAAYAAFAVVWSARRYQ